MIMWAMPGFDSYLPDTSGEYVYYKDNTFKRESYIGILYFDESTIQVRYIAPRNVEQSLPENEISILMTIDPESPHWEMTGERILSTILPNTDDVEIVNYLHDMMYEFSAHRIRISNLNDRNIKISQDFPQFGGKVIINYDCTVPIFNIKDIIKDNKKQLELCTIGQLIGNGDSSFDNFKGIPENNYKRNRKHYKSSKKEEQTFNNQKISLDKNWTQKMENLWTRDDDAVLSLNTISLPQIPNENQLKNFLIRHFIKAGQGSYLLFNTLEINEKKDTLTIQAESYNPSNEKTVVNTIIISNNTNTGYADLLSLAVYKQPWVDNNKYYEDIIKSYK